MTLQLATIGTVLGCVLGFVVGMVRSVDIDKHSSVVSQTILRILKAIIAVYVEVIRGTPLMVQATVIYYGTMSIWGLDIPSFSAGILALSLHIGAYFSESVRGAIGCIDKGQMEAARSLGMSYMQAMRTIILPQAFRRMLPALGNNAIAILKDSSLISAIGLAELAYAARTVAGASARYWEPYITISCVYWVMTLLLAWGIRRLEARLGRGDNGIGS